MLLLVIVSKDDIRRVTIDSLPETVDDFHLILRTKLGLDGDFVVWFHVPETETVQFR